jgi:hypothetical protein
LLIDKSFIDKKNSIKKNLKSDIQEWPFGVFLVHVFKTHAQTHAFTAMLDV